MSRAETKNSFKLTFDADVFDLKFDNEIQHGREILIRTGPTI